MQVSLKTTTTKPEDAIWWNVADPTASAAYGEFVSNHPAVVGRTVKNIDANTIEAQLLFEDAKGLGEFLLDLHATPFYISRQLYNKENGIVQLPSYSFTA
jgi:hypothetical protein